MTDRRFRSGLLRKTILRCVRTGILATLAFALFVAVGVFMAYNTTWQPGPLYSLLKLVQLYMSILVPLVWFLMILLIIYFYWRQTVGYIEDLAAASASLVSSDDEDIRLPEELREVELRMNQIKRTARKNEREAREAEQRKNDLVVNLAHDIRTPLSSVIGYLSLLDEAADMPPEQRAKYTGITLEKASRLEQLVNEFFEITRFNLSSVVLSMGRINLPFMLRQMADEFYPMLSPGNRQVCIYAPDELVLWGDADKLARVFNNILKNAISYSYPDSVIEISAVRQPDAVTLRFVNTGDPIPPQQLDTIFERFFRLDASRSSRTGGAGLGLAIAKEIVSAHGGTVSASSDMGKNTFTVVLPNRPDSPLKEEISPR